MPPGPVAVRVKDAEEVEVGVPLIAPVVASIVAQSGRPLALQDVAGRLAASVSAGVVEKPCPCVAAKLCPAVMIGVPAEIVKATVLAALVPPPPVAVKLAVKEPVVVGVPVMAPVAVFSARPVGSPVALQEVAGRSSASISVSVAEGNTSPTFPVKLWPSVIIGAPSANETVAVSVSEPPGPVAVSVTVAVPVSCGVPVMVPVLVLITRPAGNPVALQLVTGRFVLSVSENVLLKAVPTLPEAVCPAVMIGVP